jgi:hypothetical protein
VLLLQQDIKLVLHSDVNALAISAAPTRQMEAFAMIFGRRIDGAW